MGRDERMGLVVLVIAVIAIMALGISMHSCRNKRGKNSPKIEMQVIAKDSVATNHESPAGEKSNKARRRSSTQSDKKGKSRPDSLKVKRNPNRVNNEPAATRDFLKEEIETSASSAME